LPRLLRQAGSPLTLAALCILWEASCSFFKIPSFVLPAPSAIVRAAIGVGAQQWWVHLLATLQIALMGYLLSIAVAIPLAVVLTISRFLAGTVYPVLVIVQSTPIVAIAPVIVVMLGTNVLPRVVITFLIAFFPIVIGTAAGLRATPDELVELSRSLRASRLREYTQIRLPYAVPYIFGALKVSITLAVIGAVVAEFVASERGLGFMILFSTSQFKMPQAFAALGILVAASLLLFRAVGMVERLGFPWSVPPGERDES
jgi:NitT/TauT family transport system permease protein